MTNFVFKLILRGQSHLAPNFSACELFAKARSEKYTGNCNAPITASGNASKRRGRECLG